MPHINSKFKIHALKKLNFIWVYRLVSITFFFTSVITEVKGFWIWDFRFGIDPTNKWVGLEP